MKMTFIAIVLSILIGYYLYIKMLRVLKKERNSMLENNLKLSLSTIIHIYNSGYHAGHHDTVEGQYVDIYPSDMDTYHEDVVIDLLYDYNTDQLKG